MAKSKRAPWVKLYADYTSTPSHEGLTAEQLWVGVVLMILVRASCDTLGDREPYARTPSGSPIPIQALARRARLSVRKTNEALAMLAKTGTVAQRSDGAWGMPRFWQYQDPDAAAAVDPAEAGRWVYFAVDRDRVKIGVSANPWSRLEALRTANPTVELRAKLRGGVATERELHARFADMRIDGEWYRYKGELRSYVDSLPVATRGSYRSNYNREERGERTEDLPFGESPHPPDPRTADTVSVLTRIVEKRRELGLDPLPRARCDLQNILRVLAEHPVSDLLEVVEIRAAKVRDDAGEARFFDAISPFTGRNPNGRPGGWVVSLQQLDEARARARRQPTRSKGTTAEDFARRLEVKEPTT